MKVTFFLNQRAEKKGNLAFKVWSTQRKFYGVCKNEDIVLILEAFIK